MGTLRLNVIILVLLGALIFLQYRLWFQPGGIRDMWQLKQTILNQKNENEKLKKRNDALVFQIERLQKSEDSTEARARNELGMIKKDETFYQIVK